MMIDRKQKEDQRIAEDWGSWEKAERDSKLAFLNRSPQDRLAWLEDLLRLRMAALKVRTSESN
jgi:hypothetical protein